MPEPTAEPMTDAQWTDYLSEVLNRLSAHVEHLPADATLRELIERPASRSACCLDISRPASLKIPISRKSRSNKPN